MEIKKGESMDEFVSRRVTHLQQVADACLLLLQCNVGSEKFRQDIANDRIEALSVINRFAGVGTYTPMPEFLIVE